VAIAVAVAAFCFLFRVPFAPLWSSFAAAMYGIFKLVGRLPTPYRRAAAGSVLAVALILVPWFAFGRQGDGPSSGLVSRSGSAFRASLDRLLLQNVWTVTPQQRDMLELYRWARTQTDTGSLFFVYTERDGDNAPLAFRYYTQRSATCSYKDMGQAYYTRYRMVELFHCYSEFKEAAHDPGQLLSLLTKYGVDYAVIPVAQAQVGAIAPPLEVVFENETYRVFAVRT
jgi:energy-coupling factor transporter transmembrane protein EcfT